MSQCNKGQRVPKVAKCIKCGGTFPGYYVGSTGVCVECASGKRNPAHTLSRDFKARVVK